MPKFQKSHPVTERQENVGGSGGVGKKDGGGGRGENSRAVASTRHKKWGK